MPATLDKALAQLGLLEVDGARWDAHASVWAAQSRQWSAGGPPWAQMAVYIDSTSDPYWTRQFARSGKVERVGCVMPNLGRVVVSSAEGVPLLVETHVGTVGLKKRIGPLLKRLDEVLGPGGEVSRLTIVDSEAGTAGAMWALHNDSERVFITVLKGQVQEGVRIHSEGAWMAHRERDQIREVAIDRDGRGAPGEAPSLTRCRGSNLIRLRRGMGDPWAPPVVVAYRPSSIAARDTIRRFIMGPAHEVTSQQATVQTKQKSETKAPATSGASSVLRSALRGMDFETGEKSLAPPELGEEMGPVQRKARPGAIVQREEGAAEAEGAEADDEEMLDPAKHIGAMGKTPREKANELKPAIEAQNKAAKDAYAPIYKELGELDEQIPKLEGEDKAKAEARQKELKEKGKPLERTIKETDADLETLDDPSADTPKYNDILARQKANTKVDKITTEDHHDDPLVKKWSENKDTKTETDYADGKSTKVVEESSKKVGLGGYSQTDSKKTDEVTAEGKRSTTEGKSTSVGPKGISHESSSKDETEKEGKKESTEKKSSTQVGPSGVTRTKSEAVTKGDGSSESKSKAYGVERGDGKIGHGRTEKETTKDAAGHEETKSSKTKVGLMAGKDGIGLFGEHEKEYERKSAGGLKTGAVGGLNGNVVCNIEEVPDSDPKKYRLSLSVNLGAKLGASAGYEKEGSAGKGGASVQGSGTVTMNVSKVLTEDEAKAYVEGLKAANAGGGGTSKEFAIISCGVTKGWEAAQKMYRGATAGIADPTVLAGMQDGDKIELGKEGTLGASGNLGVEGGGIGLGVEGGYEVTRGSKMSVEKKGGKFEYTPSETEAEKRSAGGSVSVGIVKGGMSFGHTDKSGTSYKFVLDPKDPKFAEMQAALANCASQSDLDAFAKMYPKAVGEKTKISGHEDTQSGKIGVGPAEAGLAYASSYEEKTVTDAEGNFKSKSMEGTNTGGITFGVGSLKIGASSKESATAEVDAEGQATVDVGQKDTETDTAKWLEANVPFAGGPKESKDGALTKAAGGGEKANTDTQRVEGMKLSNGDLQGLGGLAMDKGKWMSACPSPRLRDDWAAAGRQIRAAGGSSAAVAQALAQFVGKDGHGRNEVVYAALRDPGEVGSGKRYEFPEGLMKLKPTYDSLVAGDPVKTITDAEAKDGKEKAKVKGTEIIGQLDSLYNSISSAASQFEQPAVQSEMLSAINTKKGEVQAKIRVLSGGKSDELSQDELREKYNGYIDNCSRFKDSETDCFAKIEETYKDDHVSLDESIQNGKLIKQLRDLYAIWDKDYEEMAALANKHGFGKDRYFKFKPDKARFNRALSGKPGEASVMTETDEDREKGKKPPPPPPQPKDPIGEENKKLEANRKQQASSIQGRISPSKNKAWGAGNRLHAWIQKDRKAMAIDAHNRGMAKLREAEAYAAKVPKDATLLDWETYGFFAVQDYGSAATIFQEGLALYPPGWPPKS